MGSGKKRKMTVGEKGVLEEAKKGWEGASVRFGLGGAFEARSTRPGVVSLLPALFLLFLKRGCLFKARLRGTGFKAWQLKAWGPGSHRSAVAALCPLALLVHLYRRRVGDGDLGRRAFFFLGREKACRQGRWVQRIEAATRGPHAAGLCGLPCVEGKLQSHRSPVSGRLAAAVGGKVANAWDVLRTAAMGSSGCVEMSGFLKARWERTCR